MKRTLLAVMIAGSAFGQCCFASLIGDSVEGVLGTAGGQTNILKKEVIQQFVSPAIVTAAGSPEFTGIIDSILLDLFGNEIARTSLTWDVNVEASQISYTLRPHGAIEGAEFFGMILSDLDWVNTPGIITNVSVIQDQIGLALFEPTFTADSVSVSFEPGRAATADALTTVLEITAVHGGDIPEPTTFVVWSILGLAISGGCWWRRGRASASK